ncbi:MAG: hypothetical protein D6800_05420 [Candidatus Zixiibacteriota bacterium]|nr:MAG: hypothetical protein D6800_05420 [candidate division Zixibacteria bacterium]
MTVIVRWYGVQVGKELKEALADLEDRILDRITVLAEENVVANDQIDTGHMRKSFYIISPRQNTYRLTHPPGVYWGRKSRAFVPRERAPEITPNADTSIAANSAPYALHPELRQSFMYVAALQMRKEAPTLIRKVGKDHFGG